MRKVFIASLSFSKSLVTKRVPLNNEPFMKMPILIGLNHVEIQCYPFMTSLDKYKGSCNSVDDLSKKKMCSKEKRHNC